MSLLLRAGAAAALILVTWLLQIVLWIGIGLLVRRALTRDAPPDRGLYERPVPVSTDRYVTDSGLVLAVPAGEEMRCLTTPPPCTPHPQPGLVARDSGDPGAGFAVRSEWRPERWPNAWRAEAGVEWSAALRERFAGGR